METLSSHSQTNSIIYPNRDELKLWARVLTEQNFCYLPEMDHNWPDDMLPAFDLVRMHPSCKNDLHEAAARIFYKINKNHRRIDGNKRSSIICTYFFYLLNGKYLSSTHQEIEGVALSVAGSQGNTEEFFIPLIKSFFMVHARDF